ncbi:MAG: hypothetical protein E7J22_13435, partial [Clostridium perfringens]|nr:hypothetical protein [Clostridium perfringens]
MAHNKSYRTFIILQEDEKGHSIASDKPLTGYAKIETKNDKCKVSFYAQNLKKEYKDCYMMLICNKKDFKKNINLGPMNINQQGKAEMSLEYDSINIGDLNVSYENIVGAAIGKNINKDKKDKDEKDKYKEYLKEKDKDYLKEENKEKECKKEYFKDKEEKEDKDDCKEKLKEEYKEKKDDCRGKDKEECKDHDKEEKHEEKCEEDKKDKDDKDKKEDKYKDKDKVDDDCKDKHEEYKEYKDKDTDKDKHEEKKIEGYKDCYKEKYHRNDNWDYRSKLQECDRFISKIDLERE